MLDQEVVQRISLEISDKVIEDATQNVLHDDDHWQVVGAVIQNLTQYLVDSID